MLELMKTGLNTSNMNRVMQISITVWVALCIGFLSAFPKATANDNNSLLQGQQIAWHDFTTLDEQSGEEEPLDDASGNEQSALQLASNNGVIIRQQHTPATESKSPFKARAPPYLPL